MQLDEFTHAYVECLLWAEMDDSGAYLDANYRLGDIAPETLQAIIADCQQFQQDNATDLAAYHHRAGYPAPLLGGHDYWLTRNHHGAGFWCRDDCLPKGARERLTSAAHKAGERYVYIGDDNLIYC